MYELIDTQIELGCDFLPNSSLTYDIYFNEQTNRFKATLSEDSIGCGFVGIEDAPKTIFYSMVKELNSFTNDEKEMILSYRGLTLDAGFCVMDVFMEGSFIKCDGVLTEVSVIEQRLISFADGESAQDFKLNRHADIYLHQYGDYGWLDKTDIGGETTIKFI